jgi:galactose mutarotase-like enzyme
MLSITARTKCFFSLGGHPAFKCPLHDDEVYEDYYLEFEAVENDATWLLEKDGLVGKQTKPVLEHTNVLHLNAHLFDNDALIFKHLISKQVSLRSTKSGQVITVYYEDFHIWESGQNPMVISYALNPG